MQILWQHRTRGSARRSRQSRAWTALNDCDVRTPRSTTRAGKAPGVSAYGGRYNPRDEAIGVSVDAGPGPKGQSEIVMRDHRIWVCSMVASLSLVSTAFAPSYTRFKLFELATVADVIVAGRIVDVRRKTFDFEVEADVVGWRGERVLRVQRFVDWTCHSRWARYAKGQDLLLFLRRAPESAACPPESWEPAMRARCRSSRTSSSRRYTHGYRVQGYEVTNQEDTGRVHDRVLGCRSSSWLGRFVGLRDSCSWTMEYGPDWSIATSACRSKKLDAYSRTSTLARHMLEEARSSRSWDRTDAGQRTSQLSTWPPFGGLRSPAVPARIHGDSRGEVLRCGDRRSSGTSTATESRTSPSEPPAGPRPGPNKGRGVDPLPESKAGGVRAHAVIP